MHHYLQRGNSNNSTEASVGQQHRSIQTEIQWQYHNSRTSSNTRGGLTATAARKHQWGDGSNISGATTQITALVLYFTYNSWLIVRFD
jgi:hypothetical protein